MFLEFKKQINLTLIIKQLAFYLNPNYALEIVMRVENPIKQTLFRLKHSTHYDEEEKVAKRHVLKGFQLVIDSLMLNLG